jgi:hypothetical protein
MSLLCDSAWFWRTQNNYEIQKLLDRARMKRLTGSCQFPLGRDASAFIASCVLRKPKDITEPPTANLFTLINSVVDRILSDQQLDSDAPERFEYTMRLCRASIPTENSYDDHIAIWHALSPKAQSLFFPVDDIISHASFDMHVLVAKVIVQNPNVEHEIRSLFLQKGRKALSIHWKRSKRTVFGGFLAAAIRGSNLDILCFLLAHDVDISRVKTGHGQKREQYDDYFLRLAVTVGDPAVLDTLLEQRYGFKGRARREDHVPRNEILLIDTNLGSSKFPPTSFNERFALVMLQWQRGYWATTPPTQRNSTLSTS